MVMPFPSLVIYQTTVEYQQHYEKFYCRENIFTFDKVRVHFKKSKFGHAFYESTGRDGNKDLFSRKRAERIDWIKATIENPEAELFMGWNKRNKIYDRDRRVSIVYESFVVVIEIYKRDTYCKPISANFITAYVAEDRTMRKIKDSPKWDI